MVEKENEGKFPIAIVIGVVVVILVLAVLRFGFGIMAIGSFVKGFLFFVVIAGILGLVFYVIYWLFFKEHKIDVTFVNKQKLVDSAITCKSPALNDLYLSGDEGHQSVRLGKIIGWCRIQILDTPSLRNVNPDPKDVTENEKGSKDKDKDKKKKSKENIIKIKEQDVFVFKKSGFPFSAFEDGKVLRVDPEDHTDLVGDVRIKGFSIIKLSEYFFLNKDHLDLAKIDYNLLQEAKRGVLFLNLAEMKEIVDIAIGISPRHQKQLQVNQMLKIPSSPPQPPAQ